MIDLFVISILGLIDLALIAGFYLYSQQVSKEREKFINALISRNATEMRDLELADKVEPIKTDVPQMPDFTAVADLDDSEFEKVVLEREDGSA